MRLLVIRHGIAEDRGQGPDHERALTDKGRQRMKKIALALRKLEPSLDLLATSPLVRARETADLVADPYSVEPEVTAHLEPDAPLGRLLEWIAAQSRGVVAIVGHEPSLSTFASWLISARPESHLELKKGGACLIELPAQIAPGNGTLEWLLTPKQLRRLA